VEGATRAIADNIPIIPPVDKIAALITVVGT
jgi:hypothetical protein